MSQEPRFMSATVGSAGMGSSKHPVPTYWTVPPRGTVLFVFRMGISAMEGKRRFVLTLRTCDVW